MQALVCNMGRTGRWRTCIFDLAAACSAPACPRPLPCSYVLTELSASARHPGVDSTSADVSDLATSTIVVGEIGLPFRVPLTCGEVRCHSHGQKHHSDLTSGSTRSNTTPLPSPRLNALDAAGEPVAPADVHVPNVEAASLASLAIAFALPDPDVAAGYFYSLTFLPGNAEAFPVTSAAVDGVSKFAVSRSDSAVITADDTAHTLSLKLNLASKFCSTDANGECGTGKYRLASLAAASYWTDAGATPIDLAQPWDEQSPDEKAAVANLAANAMYFYVGVWQGRMGGVWGVQNALPSHPLQPP